VSQGCARQAGTRPARAEDTGLHTRETCAAMGSATRPTIATLRLAQSIATARCCWRAEWLGGPGEPAPAGIRVVMIPTCPTIAAAAHQASWPAHWWSQTDRCNFDHT